MGGVVNILVRQVKGDDLAVAGVMPMCNLRQARRFVVPCFSNNHSPVPRNFSPVLVDDQVSSPVPIRARFANRQSTRSPAQRPMIGNRQVDLQHFHDRSDQAFALAKRQSKYGA